MNYSRIYDQLLNKVRQFEPGDYSEVHHVVPRSIGGSNERTNLVRLTAREHYIAHLLLVKIHQTNPQFHVKLLYALNCMRWGGINGNRKFRYNSRLYQRMREKYASVRKQLMAAGVTNPTFGKIWIYCEELRQSKVWDKNTPIPDGWRIGRIIDWGKHLNRIEQLKVKNTGSRLNLTIRLGFIPRCTMTTCNTGLIM